MRLVLFMLLQRYQQDIQKEICRGSEYGIGGWERPELAGRA